MTPSGHLSNIDEILCTLISRLFSKSVNAKLSAGFFCQIIMGSPLNSNVSEGLSVLQCLDKILYSCVFTKKIVSIRKRKLERIQQKFVLLCFRAFIFCYPYVPETEVGKNISIIWLLFYRWNCILCAKNVTIHFIIQQLIFNFTERRSRSCTW